MKNPDAGRVTHFVQARNSFDQINSVVNSRMDIVMQRHETLLKVNKFYQGSLSNSEKYVSIYPKKSMKNRSYIDTST